ncbi:hypothetical protein P153DRAFT_316163 [Dothidotthia symphoricarpi CBS 119687]|uniref:BTB domain-containing protein n=1 Tax=Dothidotthia symphoricarpi CBS 119687 TaxID=1392245 RepID=A0A6A6AEA3_9PLEO|nr:uncharacterized protein P153DRAFT_316163 [Dothidotthia symphoricarpi CBS 119687]KAF2129318.1 hypothetical protein P153DRAFT_316163 [Dothidotthia symphoricarpi CBS 119687]
MTLIDETNNTLDELTQLFDALNKKTSTSIHADVVTLDVGGRKFKASRNTLFESGLFRRLLSDSYAWVPESDGSYYIDADPELFEHLLHFMRRPSVFPLFYDKVAGFDYNTYNRLQGEAKYFRVDALHEWISEKRYLQAVVVKTSGPFTRSITQPISTELPADKSDEWQIVSKTKKVYLCPRLILVHKGHPEICGAACRSAQAGFAVQYEDELSLEIISVQKETVFNEEVCRTDIH